MLENILYFPLTGSIHSFDNQSRCQSLDLGWINCFASSSTRASGQCIRLCVSRIEYYDVITDKLANTYSGPAIRVRHSGSYRQLGTTHRKIAAYLAALGLERNGDAWETYISDPTRVPEAELLTDIYYPVRKD